METLEKSLSRYALIGVVAALATIALKGGGYALTGSVAILSDALESLINLATSVMAAVILGVAARPADEEHAYGHSKAEYFASGFEGAVILAAALTIGFTAARRLVDPAPLQAVGLGLAVTGVATAINLIAARWLFQLARQFRSIALEAGAHHLMVDVWTSVGVIVGVGAAGQLGWEWLDPVIALLVAINILRIGVRLLRGSLLGLLDTALPEETRQRIVSVLEAHRPAGVQYHALRTRQAGAWGFISVHILVPGDWTVQQGHDLLETIEARVREAVPDSTVFTHLEPLEDPVSWEDVGLHRPGPRV